MLNFIGIGAQKSGTTWLHQTLARQQQIAFPAGKEVHFWGAGRARGLDWYRALFADDARINGEITPAYAILPAPDIAEIRCAFPHARLLYLIRNPVERAWSSARMALKRAEMQHHEASDQWFIDHVKSQGSRARGDYETCIRNWRSVFPAEQLLIERYENIVSEPVALANRCLSHIGLEPVFTQSDGPELSRPVFAGDGVAMPASLRRIAVSIYRDQISSLEDYLQLDFSSWKKQGQGKT